MNVLDVKVESRPMTASTLVEMLSSRREVWRGFAALEEDRGGLPQMVHLSTSRGQEVARSLIMRAIEEVTEAMDSEQREHMLEELIDAMNYLWSLLIIDAPRGNAVPPDSCLLHLLAGRIHWGSGLVSELFLGQFAFLSRHLLAKFRNRPWQNAPQSLYFDGWQELEWFVVTASAHLMSCFKSWDEFCTLWWAKDEVLRFRLRSKY